MRGVERSPGPRFVPYLAGMVLAISGRMVHDVMELGALAPDWPFTIALIPGALLYWWYRTPGHVAVVWATLAWLLLNAVGGGVLAVLPLPIWPVVPAQDLPHYLAHAIYTAAQLPLAWWVWRQYRRAGP